MSKFRYLVVFSTLLVSIMSKVEAAELSLICPCKAERFGQTAVKITAGIKNTGGTESSELRLRLVSSATLLSNLA